MHIRGIRAGRYSSSRGTAFEALEEFTSPTRLGGYCCAFEVTAATRQNEGRIRRHIRLSPRPSRRYQRRHIPPVLLEALRAQSATPLFSLIPSSHMLKIPPSTPFPQYFEQLQSLPITYHFHLHEIWLILKTKPFIFPLITLLDLHDVPPWTFPPIKSTALKVYNSRVQLLSLPQPLIASTLQICRENKSTLTGLLHVLIISTLNHHLHHHSKEPLLSSTPYSLRK